ncbi:MAG: PAS domain S-box protein [Candidatus Tenebribacter davisii]|nr:PAS domain S-box protein [Candidatus Tenebribacter davisii]
MNNKQSKITNQDLKDRITKLKEEKKELKARIAAFKKSNTVCKLTEESLKESKEKLRLIIDNSRIGICVTDLKGNFIDVNNALTKMLGYSKKEMLGKHFNHFTLPDDRVENDTLFKSLIDGKISYFDLEKRYLHKNGKIIYIYLRSQLVRNEDGKPISEIAVMQDITERIQAEKIRLVQYNISNAVNTTKNLEELYKIIHQELGKIIDTTNFYIALYNEKTDMVYSPYFISKKTNINQPAEMRKNGVSKYIINNARSLFLTEDLRKELIKEGKISNYDWSSKTLLGVPLRIGEKVVGCIVVRSSKEESDYSVKDLNLLEFISNQVAIAISRKQSEHELQKTKNLLESTLNSISDVIGIQNQNYEMIRYNNAGYALLNMTPDEISGKKCYELIGRDKPCEICATSNCYKSKKPEKIEIYSNEFGGWFDIRAYPILDSNGKLINVVIYLRNITQQKNTDKQIQKSRELLKSVTSILRHDIANDLAVIKSALKLYRKTADEKMLDEINNRVTKGINTIDTQRKQESFIDLHQNLTEFNIKDVIMDYSRNYPNIEINVSGDASVYADDQLYLAIDNLISNSIIHGKATKLNVNIESKKDMCEIKFSDNGSGIPENIKSLIFDEEFSYGKMNHNGMGLHIVKNIIKDYSGNILVSDNKPRGTVFTIQLKNVIKDNR